MARFLHIADIHLGYDRYNNWERTKDFFYTLRDVILRHAIAAEVDCVVIAGDLFEHRNIRPAVLNQAQIVLRDLKTAGIPAIAIEGNHDNRPYGTKTGWLQYLVGQGDLILLEPDLTQPEGAFQPWDDRRKRGGYIDLDCGLRVLGSAWYGATAPQAIARLAEEVQTLPPLVGSTIMLFHHGLEGQIARYAGALRYTDLLPLRQAGVDYLALGHIHKNYTAENWIYNPGSLEANSVEEADYQRGAYLVEVTADGLQATLQQDYRQRSTVRLSVTLTGQEAVAVVEEQAEAVIQTAIANGKLDPETQPIVELRLRGTVGFDRLELDTRALQAQLQTQSNALVFLLKYEVEEKGYESPLQPDASRSEIEQEVFTDLLNAHQTYAKRAEQLALGLMDFKERQLRHEPDEALYAFMDTLLNEPDYSVSPAGEV